MTNSIPKYGQVQIDLAFMNGGRDRGFNGGYKGFLLAVEMTTKQLAAVPIRSKKLSEVERAIGEIFETSAISKIRTLISDREAAVTSPKFRLMVRTRYGAELVYLPHRNKAYLAELYIRHVKTALSMAMESRKAAGKPDYRNWKDLLPRVLSNLNRKFEAGTRFRRNSIDEENFQEFLNEKYGVKDATMMWNTRSVGGGGVKNPSWKKKIWKYAPGDRVLVNKRVLGAGSGDGGNGGKGGKGGGSAGIFSKPSVRGGYSRSVYVVTRRYLKSSGQFFLTPGTTVANLHYPDHWLGGSKNFNFLSVYKLRREEDGRAAPGAFYQSELTPVYDKNGSG